MVCSLAKESPVQRYRNSFRIFFGGYRQAGMILAHAVNEDPLMLINDFVSRLDGPNVEAGYGHSVYARYIKRNVNLG